MSERDEAIALANKLLDEPYADPDDDLRLLSRQFLREIERTKRKEIVTMPPTPEWFVGKSQQDEGEPDTFDGTIWELPTPEERANDGVNGFVAEPWLVAEHIRDEGYAHLIAAAPKLLAACEAARAFGSQGDTHEGVSVSYLLETAIAAAKGGA